MKFSSKVEKCGQSPMRKFHPYAVAAKARGIKVYHLNIGQPDVQTPPAFFEAIRKFEQPVLEYAPSPGIPELIDAIKGYYDKLDMHFDKSEIYITTGGSEALLAGILFFWVAGKDFVLAAVNKGAGKPIGAWFYPLSKYVYCACALLALIAGALLGGIG